MHFHDQMERAVTHAALEHAKPTNIDAQIVTPPEVVNLAELSDNQILDINPRLIELPPNLVAADLHNETSVDVLRPIAHAFNDVTGQKLDESWIDAMIQHEGEHWAAGQALGATAGRLVVKVSVADVIDGKTVFGVQPFTRPENFSTTKLGHAAMTARPKTLSPSDMQDLAQMGYGNVFDLTKKIIEHNDRVEEAKAYPIPFMLDREKALRILL
jgi:hypothetical protein